MWLIHIKPRRAADMLHNHLSHQWRNARKRVAVLLRVVTNVIERTPLSVISNIAGNVANRVDKHWNRCRNMWFWQRIASAGRGTKYTCLFLFLFIFYFFLPFRDKKCLSLTFPLPFSFSFLGLDSLSFSISIQFLGWLKSCGFLKKDSFSWSYFFSYSQTNPNITRASIISTPFSTDCFIGHSFIPTLSIVVLPSRCTLLYYKLGAQQFLRSQKLSLPKLQKTFPSPTAHTS